MTGYGERVYQQRMLSLSWVQSAWWRGGALICLVDKDSCHFNCQDHLELTSFHDLSIKIFGRNAPWPCQSLLTIGERFVDVFFVCQYTLTSPVAITSRTQSSILHWLIAIYFLPFTSCCESSSL